MQTANEVLSAIQENRRDQPSGVICSPCGKEICGPIFRGYKKIGGSSRGNPYHFECRTLAGDEFPKQ